VVRFVDEEKCRPFATLRATNTHAQGDKMLAESEGYDGVVSVLAIGSCNDFSE
jgi:hypothetical protein